MLVNLSQKFFYDRELFKPANNPVTLPEEAVEHLNDNDTIVEASPKAKARFEELKQERLDARSFESKDAVGKLQARLDVLEDKSPAGGKDHSADIAKLSKALDKALTEVDKLSDAVEALQKEVAKVKADAEASALATSEQLAELTESLTAQPKAPESETTPAKKTSTAL